MEMTTRLFYNNQHAVKLHENFSCDNACKIRLYRSQNILVGFATWTFLTKDEAVNRTFNHDAVARNNGDQVWVVDMCSQNNVLFYIARDMRTFLTENIMKYAGHKRAYWNRPNKINSRKDRSWVIVEIKVRY